MAQTDFEALGLSTLPATTAARSWLLTVDFEAFGVTTIQLWCIAMDHWAKRASSSGLPFCFFVAVEDVVALRRQSRTLYDEFLARVGRLHRAGCAFYPHNHFLFDVDTGQRPGDIRPRPGRIPGYRKRPSFYYDVVRRHSASLPDWMIQIAECHARFLADAGIEAPARSAFRAGGWDCGSDRRELENYVGALEAAAFEIDSSATIGEYGTSTWQIAVPFGSSLFWLSPRVLEVAPSWSIDCGARLWSRATADSVRSLAKQYAIWKGSPGALVTVVHFDHLFHERGEGVLNRRIDAFFQRLGAIRRLLRVDPVTFDGLSIAADRR